MTGQYLSSCRIKKKKKIWEMFKKMFKKVEMLKPEYSI